VSIGEGLKLNFSEKVSLSILSNDD